MASKSTISIGICTSNDGGTIKNLLQDLGNIVKYHRQKHSFKIKEIIIVSSGSFDGTNEVIKSFKDNFKKQYHLFVDLIIEDERSGKSAALNIILKCYTSDFLVLIPADIRIIKPKSLFYLINYLQNNPMAGVVSGSPLINHNISHCNTACRVGAVIWRLHNKNLEKLNIEENSHASGEIMAMRKGIINYIPPTVINDDAYISVYARKQQWLIGYEPQAQVYISTPHSLRDYYIQRKRVVMGHKQLKHLKNTSSSSSTPKTIFWSKPFFIVQLLLNSFHYPSDVFYFLVALVLEINIELQSFLNLSKIHPSSRVWQRITSDKATQI